MKRFLAIGFVLAALLGIAYGGVNFLKDAETIPPNPAGTSSIIAETIPPDPAGTSSLYL